MIIYKDIITGDEMFSDIYKIKESDNGVLIEVEGKASTREGQEGIAVANEESDVGEESSQNAAVGEPVQQMVHRTEDFDDALIGGNASAEIQDEGCDSTSVSGIDIILNHKLQETTFTKEAYKVYIKEYLKAIKVKLEEINPDRVKGFMTGAQGEIKKIMGNMKNYQFYTGETMNPEGMVGLLDFREDGITPFMTFFKDGLEIEKC